MRQQNVVRVNRVHQVKKKQTLTVSTVDDAGFAVSFPKAAMYVILYSNLIEPQKAYRDFRDSQGQV